MNYKYLKNHLPDIFIFLALVLIVSWLQIVLLEPHVHYGFTADDWWPLAHYNILGGDLLSNILSTWKQHGIYTSYQVFYISILHHFFGFNFQAYQITNHILKALSALAVYPLILIVFKKRMLAFVTTILYAMAYATVGTLELAVRGSDFIAIIFMCIFLTFYYYVLEKGKKSILWLTFLALLLFMSMFFSPIRIYPILLFILLVEFYFIIVKRSKLALLRSVKRMLFLFFPYLLMLILSPDSVLRFLNVNAPEIFRRITVGNWQLLLYPFGSFGSLFFLNDYWKIFGTIQTKNLASYIIYLIFNQLIIYLLISLFYSIIISSKRIIKLIMKILLINFTLQISIYFIAKHWESIQSDLIVSYNYNELQSVFFAVFILVLSFVGWQEWRRDGKRNNLLFALWLGSTFSLVFIILTWIFKDWVVLFKGVHTYLNIPSIGSSLFIGSTIVLLYQKVRGSFKDLGKYLAPWTFLLLIPIFNISSSIISYHWDLSKYSMNANEHEKFRQRLWSQLVNFDILRPSFFYFNTFEDRPNGRFYEQSMMGRFSHWMFFQANYPKESCNLPIFINDNINLLRSIYKEKDGEKGFLFRNYCNGEVFYKLKDFYAFKLINKQPININDEILKELETSP